MRRLKVPDDIAALIRGLHPDLKRRVRSALGDIVDDPAIGKPLRDELAGLRSCRVSRFRIVYRVSGAAIELVALGPRRTIYQDGRDVVNEVHKRRRAVRAFRRWAK